MLLVIPALLMLLAAVLIVAIDKISKNFAIAFLVASISAFAAWLVTLFSRIYLPSTLLLIPWKPETLYPYAPSLLLDYQSWPFALAIISICIAGIFTDSARSSTESNPRSWAGILSISALGMIALLSGNPFTLMMTWTLLDIVEFIHFITSNKNRDFDVGSIIVLSFHISSLIMLGWAIMVGWHEIGKPFDITNIPANASVYFLLSAGLRLGILPLSLFDQSKPQFSRGIDTIVRLVPVASSLSLIGRLSNTILLAHPILMALFQAIIALTALFAAITWIKEKDEVKSQLRWITAFSAFSLFSAVNGNQISSRVWGIALLLSGGLFFLYQPKIWRLRFLLLFGVLGIIALPYTPAAAGWEGIIGDHFNLWSLIIMIAHVILVLGYMRNFQNSLATSDNLETWAKIIFPLGLIILIQSSLVIGVIGWPGSFSLGVWWFSAINVFLTASIFFVFRRYKIDDIVKKLTGSNRSIQTLINILKVMSNVSLIKWIRGLFVTVSQLLSSLLISINNILEGEGGVMWALLILLLLITLIVST